MRNAVDSLSAGSHVCATYRTADERDAIVTSFVRAAEADGWLAVALDRHAAAAVYGDRPTTDPHGLVADFERHARVAVAKGYRGLALTADPTSMVSTPESRAAFARVEHLADRMVHSTKIIAGLCLYDESELGREAVDDLGSLHRCSWPNDTAFHLCANVDQTLAIDGELDIATLAGLERALHAAASGTTTVVVDAASLAFIDHRSLLVIDNLADEAQQTVVIRNAPSIVRRLVELTETHHIVLERS